MPTDRSGFRVARSRLELSYRLSTDDRVLEVDSGWSGFAQANAASGLDPEAVIGQPVWTPFNRPCEEHESRKKYVEGYLEEKKTEE